MTAHEHLPTDFETLLHFPNGYLWLYSDKHTRKIPGMGRPEYKVYSTVPEVKKALQKVDGVERAADYYGREGSAIDFIVQSFAIKAVLEILQHNGFQQTAIEF